MIDGLEIFQQKDNLIIGIDPGLGLSSNTALEAIDLSAGEQVAEYLGKANHYQLCEIIDYLKQNFTIKTIVIEANTFGKLFIDEITRNFPDLDLFSSDGKNPGFKTTKETKEALLFNYVFQTLKENPNVLYSKRLYAQLQELQIDKKTGKIKSAIGTDLIMAFGFAIVGRIDYLLNKASFTELNEIVYMPKELKFNYDEIVLPQRLSWNKLQNWENLSVKELVEQTKKLKLINYLNQIRR